MTDQDADLPEPGPTPEEQARVDAEQRELIERIRSERAPLEAEERRRMDAKISAAREASSQRRAAEARLDARLTEIEARLTGLEASR